MKICQKCNKSGSFSKDKTHPDGLAKWCKSCALEYQVAYIKKNPRNFIAYRKANLERVRLAGRKGTAKSYADKIQRTPHWADFNKINEWYKAAAFATEFFEISIEVDHIIPLKGKYVSGLHVHYNMQLLTKENNRKKRNIYNFEK